MELMTIALKVLNNLIEQKVKTYIHCKNGHGRTSAFLGSYFIYNQDLTTDEALKLVKEKRPSMHLNEVQIAFLREFEKALK